MKYALLSLSMLGLLGLGHAATAADVAAPRVVPVAPVVVAKTPPVILQIGPTTPYSTIDCTQFTKLPDGSWQSIGPGRFSLGFTQGIVPPVRPIKVGSFIYNNIDLYSQLEAQCAATLVRAAY